MEFNHKPVMLWECIEELKIKPNNIYVDGTLGGAGHSREIARRLSNKGLLIGIDKDEDAIRAAKNNLKEYGNIRYVYGNHDNIKELLINENIKKVDGVLLDLGVSSYQLDERNRGFSYLGSAILDMRMDKSQELTAEKIVNSYTEEELVKILFEYGEEKYSKIIAKNICNQRQEKPIRTTEELVRIIENSIPKSKQKDGHPAKRTFQALRIEVNDELRPLYNTVRNCIDCLNVGGRLCIITFHSLEDRIVKKAYVDAQGKCTCPSDLPYCVCNFKSFGQVVTRKPIIASKDEIRENSRAKSAKLRVFERV
ncbi:MAG: 16S rRNA (cytosine(1402)-N(4))-methyltransferase RsmH [Clostridia bacterium]|nr:16S rRNA (cytosine(1402)-N(4))-methyltransferase RsmH [Clostridia bacterium]